MKIVVVGMGYVGLSNAILLAQNNQVIAFDISSKKIQMLNSGCSPIEDDEIKEFLAGNLCRCSGYEGQLRGIKNYLNYLEEKGNE